MQLQLHPFGPRFVLGGMLYDRALGFRFEVWSHRAHLPKIVVKQIFKQWMLDRPRGEPQKKFRTVRVQYYGGPF